MISFLKGVYERAKAADVQAVGAAQLLEHHGRVLFMGHTPECCMRGYRRGVPEPHHPTDQALSAPVVRGNNTPTQTSRPTRRNRQHAAIAMHKGTSPPQEGTWLAEQLLEAACEARKPLACLG